MKIDPNAPAYPIVDNQVHAIGLTIRAEIASRAMAALIQKTVINVDGQRDAAYHGGFTAPTQDGEEWEAARDALAFADALIAELNREEKP